MISVICCEMASPVNHLIRQNDFSDKFNPVNDDQMLTKWLGIIVSNDYFKILLAVSY